MEGVPGKVGQVIADRYELRELIGQGGMGCVWRAQHLALDTPVAIKLLTPTTGNRGDAHARFIREAKAAAALKSSNVVHILDHGVDGDVPYIAMEFLEGETLKSCIKREKRLSPTVTAMVMKSVLRAVARAHRAGIVHRDLKPDNIFLVNEGDETNASVVKVLDFGIAKLIEREKADDDVSTRTGAMLGTPFYMSPEQARGLSDLDARSDLWSIAVITFECLTGTRPFEANVIGNLIMMICSDPIPIPSDVAPVPPGFDAWFARATQRDRAQRYQNVRELAAALANVLTPGERWLESREQDGSTAVTPPGIDDRRELELAATEAQPEHAITATSAAHTVRPRSGSSTARRALTVGVAVLCLAGVGLAANAIRPRPTVAGSAGPTAPAAASEARKTETLEPSASAPSLEATQVVVPSEPLTPSSATSTSVSKASAAASQRSAAPRRSAGAPTLPEPQPPQAPTKEPKLDPLRDL